MATVSIVCEQAIFTSARSATGEGYRIVAASKGLRSEEKQKITRSSPSHESLCVSADQESAAAGDAQRRDPRTERGPVAPGLRVPPKPMTLVGVSTSKPAPVPGIRLPQHSPLAGAAKGVGDPNRNARVDSRMPAQTQPDGSAIGAAFYSLPGGRWCVALSRHAGAEHSGRGGQCVHTHNIVITEDDLARCAYNPVAIIRALLQLPFDQFKGPQPNVLSALELQVDPTRCERFDQSRAALLPSEARVAALQTLLEEKPLVIDLPKEWLFWAETLLLAVPGPMRCQISFAAGLRFSLGRGHTLHVLRDEKSAVQSKVEAQGIQFVEARSTPQPHRSCWLDLAAKYWASSDLAGLARRTSRPFDDCSLVARERIAELYNSIDAMPQSDAAEIINMVVRSFEGSFSGVEKELRHELREAALASLRSRLAAQTWTQCQPLWGRFVELWQKGGERAAFAQPLLDVALSAAMKSDPLLAAELGIAVARPSAGVDTGAHEAMLQQLLTRLCVLDPGNSNEIARRVASVIPRWREARPACPLVAQLTDRMANRGFQKGA